MRDLREIVNAQAILNTIARLEREPDEGFDIRAYFSAADGDEPTLVSAGEWMEARKEGTCRTAACLAGWGLMAGMAAVGNLAANYLGMPMVETQTAERHLTVDEFGPETDDLFMPGYGPSNWPKYDEAPQHYTRRRAIATLRGILNTGVVDWFAFDAEGMPRG